MIPSAKLKDEEFVKYFEKKVVNTIKRFKLISSKDKVFVAVSGGKDSTVVLYILNKYFPKKVNAITINALIGNYSLENLKNIKDFCKKQKIKLNIISFRDEFGYSLCYIRQRLNKKGIKLKSCTICGILKRYLLNKYSEKHKATKLVTGHNMDDECQNILMNLFKNHMELSARLGPITGIQKNKKFVPRIKPLYLCYEDEVERYSKIMDFPVKYGYCPCSHDAFRRFVASTIDSYEEKEFSEKNILIKQNIIDDFLKNIPKMKKYYSSNIQQKYCENCREPSQGDICRTCQILEHLKK